MKKVAVTLALLIVAVSLALWQSETDVAAQDDNPAAPLQIVDTYELMEILFEPVFDELKFAMSKEPENRKAWRAIYDESFATAEMINLLFSRSDEDYMAEPEWGTMAVAARDRAKDLGKSVRSQDYNLLKTKYVALVEACNKCHTHFVKDDATILEPWGEEDH